MKKAIKTLLIIAAICGGVGILMIGIGVATGATMGEFAHETQQNNLLRNMHISFGDWWCEDDECEVSMGQIRQEYDVNQVENLEVTLNAGELEFLNSDSDKIIVEIAGQTSEKDISLKDTTLFVEDRIYNGVRTDGVRMWIYLPEDMKLKDLNLTIHAGTASIEADQIMAENVDIEVDAGELTVEGSVYANKDTSVTVGAGRADIDYLSTGKLELECGMGETNLSLDAQDDVSISCGMGEVNLKLYGTEESFNYDLECGIGEMRVGSSSYSGLGSSRTIDNGADKKLEAECGVGQMNIQFVR